MELAALLLTISTVHLLGVMSPGPDFVLTIRNSVVYSRRTGILTAVGIGFGILVHIAYCIAGLGLIISKSILLFNAIKYLGAAYLVYIGIQSLRSRSNPVKIDHSPKEKKADLSPFQALKIGFLANVLNPKATVYFLSVISFFVTPDLSTFTLILITVIMVLLTILWFGLLAIFITYDPILNQFNKAQNAFTKLFGGLLVLLGIKIAIT